MRGHLFLPIILISIGISLLPFGSGTCKLYTEPKTVTVPDDFSSIQGAIDAANPGDTVYVRNGTYFEHLIVNKTISLIGENKDETFIDGNGSTVVLGVFDASNATVQNLTVQDGMLGLYLVDANYTKLRNIRSRNNQYNFDLIAYGGIQNLIEDIDESNTVDDKPIYFWINRENEQVPSDAGYVALVNCINITVRGPTLTKNIDGMMLINVKDCLIENVTITETQVPLRTDGVNNSILRSNLVANNTAGVLLVNCNHTSFNNNTVMNIQQASGVNLFGSFNTISGNTILNSTHDYSGLQIAGDSNLITANKVMNNTYGIRIGSSSYNNVSDNQIEMNFFSQLEFFNSSFNTVSGNRIIGNMSGSSFQYETGIDLNYYSDNNTIIENLIEGNSYGIRIIQSEYNLIFHNNIVNNVVQAYVMPYSSIATHVYSNTWDNGYPSGGNHWGDYSGVDRNHDGIGDTQYAVYDANIDNYPLINPYVVPEFYYMMYLPLFVFSTLAAAAIQKRKKKA